jgi:hypothetical protein
MPVDPLGAMPHGHDLAICSKHRICVEMGFDPLVGIDGDLPAKFGTSFMIKEENRPSSMIMCLAPKVEQTLDDDWRDTPLLKARLSMMSDR